MDVKQAQRELLIQIMISAREEYVNGSESKSPDVMSLQAYLNSENFGCKKEIVIELVNRIVRAMGGDFKIEKSHQYTYPAMYAEDEDGNQCKLADGHRFECVFMAGSTAWFDNSFDDFEPDHVLSGDVENEYMRIATDEEIRSMLNGMSSKQLTRAIGILSSCVE